MFFHCSQCVNIETMTDFWDDRKGSLIITTSYYRGIIKCMKQNWQLDENMPSLTHRCPVLEGILRDHIIWKSTVTPSNVAFKRIAHDTYYHQEQALGCDIVSVSATNCSKSFCKNIFHNITQKTG